MTIEHLACLPWISGYLQHLIDVMIDRPSPDLSFLCARHVGAGVTKCLLQLLVDVFSVVDGSTTLGAVKEIRLAV